MIIFITHNNEVIGLNADNSIKYLPNYLDDDNVILVEKELEFIPLPDNDNNYIQMWDPMTQEIYLECLGPKPKPPISLDDLDLGISTLSQDQLTSMELDVDTNQKVALSQEDGLLIMELLLDIQTKLAQK